MLSENTMTDTLQILDTQVGDGVEAKPGMRITVHYTGKLEDDTVFDSSVTRGQPFTFTLGEGRVIQGWEQGFAGMKTGGRRTLTIPPHLGYGERGAGGVIPPNATLVFDVELLAAEEVPAPGELEVEEVLEGGGDEAVFGKEVSVHYTGKLVNGTVFDSSVERGEPIEFTLGAGMVIPGWEYGIRGMRVGGKRILRIPYNLAYGPDGYPGVIPPYATLIFDVELVGVR